MIVQEQFADTAVRVPAERRGVAQAADLELKRRAGAAVRQAGARGHCALPRRNGGKAKSSGGGGFCSTGTWLPHASQPSRRSRANSSIRGKLGYMRSISA